MAETHERYDRGRTSQPRLGLSHSSADTYQLTAILPYSGKSRRLPELLLTLPAWPAISTPSTDISKTRHLSFPPLELYELPLDDDIPVEILSINRWSLIRPSSRPDGLSAPELLAEECASSNPVIGHYAIDQGGDSSHELPNNYNKKGTEAVCTSGSVSKEKRRSHLSDLHCNLKNSIHDFTSDLRDSLELTICAKAALNARKRERTRTIECTSCFDDIIAVDSRILNCSHAYCKVCFATLIRTSLQNEQSWPPKCCLKEVPLKVVLLALNTKQRAEYKEKAAEYAIPPGDRLYCPGPKCRKFIPHSKTISSSLSTSLQSCPHCSLKVCRICCGEAHVGQQDCPEDLALNAALEAAHEEGWQRCFRCRTMVELITGGRHITCKCSAQFCYVFGLKWRTCACTESDSINRRAEVNRRKGQRIQRNAVRDAAVFREEHEIARAIAEVAEFEQSQVVIRAAAEREHDRERQEEELLARLEELSAEEERQRLRTDALAERVRQDVLRLSMIEHITSLHGHLESLVLFQQQALHSRHDSDMNSLNQSFGRHRVTYSNRAKTMLTILKSNTEKRRRIMVNRHSREIEIQQIEQQRREDTIFLKIKPYMEDKSDR